MRKTYQARNLNCIKNAAIASSTMLFLSSSYALSENLILDGRVLQVFTFDNPDCSGIQLGLPDGSTVFLRTSKDYILANSLFALSQGGDVTVNYDTTITLCSAPKINYVISKASEEGASNRSNLGALGIPALPSERLQKQ